MAKDYFFNFIDRFHLISSRLIYILEYLSSLNSEHYRENTKQSQSILRSLRPRRGSPQPQGDQYGVQQVCSLAGVEGHTPHDASHAMSQHLTEKTENIAAVQ